jgi:hypothetical protein
MDRDKRDDQDDSDEDTSFGVFKPVGYVVISFPDQATADAAALALQGIGLHGQAVRALSDKQMLAQIERDLAQASPLAAMGQELNLVLAHRDLAEKGSHWLIVHAPDDDLAAKVAELASQHGAQTAQSYGRFIIEELIDSPDDLPQVSESPDRGLDLPKPAH